MSATEALLSEYRNKLLPSIELIIARAQLLKSPNPLPEKDFRKLCVEVIESASKKAVHLLDYYSDPTKYDDENPSDLPRYFAADLRAPIENVLAAATLLAEDANDIGLVS